MKTAIKFTRYQTLNPQKKRIKHPTICHSKDNLIGREARQVRNWRNTVKKDIICLPTANLWQSAKQLERKPTGLATSRMHITPDSKSGKTIEPYFLHLGSGLILRTTSVTAPKVPAKYLKQMLNTILIAEMFCTKF